jgi:hypothetical protein
MEEKGKAENREAEQTSKEANLDLLLWKLGSRRYETWKTASLALTDFGPAAIESLVRLMTHGDADIRAKASVVLGAMDDVRVLAYLIPLLHDEDASVAGDALSIIRNLGSEDATDLARSILVQPDLTGSERLHLLRLLEQIVGREWKTKLRYPLGSLYLFCRQQARSDIESLRAGAKSVLDALTLPRASQSGTSREMLRAAYQSHAEPANTLLRPYKGK